MPELPEHPVHLIHISLGIVVLHTQLITVGFADAAVLVCPGVPDVAAEIMDVVALFLPDPEQFIYRAFEILAPQGQHREFLPQVIAVDHPEAFDRVGRRSVLPMRAHRKIRIPHAVIPNITAGFNE